jgi:DNA-directed RNA polymerase subunit RPC12/RpoP
MYKDTLMVIATVLVIFGTVFYFAVQPFVSGFSGISFRMHPFLLGGAFVSFLYSFVAKDRPKTIYKCENCGVELKHLEIKFGICPNCGAKIKSYKRLPSDFFSWESPPF